MKYALVGAAGYIAPRHLKAMVETGGDLVLAYDVSDSVGIMDRHFPNAAFFTEFEHFYTHAYDLQSGGAGIDYAAICSPNYLHKPHVAFALRVGADAICEKPLVLDPQDLDDLVALEHDTGRRIHTILQLRLHPAMIELKKKISAAPAEKTWDVDLGYFTSRGSWYHKSWKGSEQKSGGIVMNIGVHFYDMLTYLFGRERDVILHHRSPDSAAGYLELERARVRWVLSINQQHLPSHTPVGRTTHRSITIDGQEIEFSEGFTELHTASYKNVLSGKGFGIDVVRPSIELVDRIRHAPITQNRGEQHPDLAKVIGR